MILRDRSSEVREYHFSSQHSIILISQWSHLWLITNRNIPQSKNFWIGFDASHGTQEYVCCTSAFINAAHVVVQRGNKMAYDIPQAPLIEDWTLLGGNIIWHTKNTRSIICCVRKMRQSACIRSHTQAGNTKVHFRLFLIVLSHRYKEIT